MKTRKEHNKKSTRIDKNGWIYINIFGSPYERGLQYGKHIKKELNEILTMLDNVLYQDTGYKWNYFVELSEKHLHRIIFENFSEFYKEMEGISKGSGITLENIIAWNNYITLVEYLYPSLSGSKERKAEGGGERCSAFMACGEYTKDGKIVMAHNNFSNFVDGQYANVVVSINPEKGNKILMQGFPGWIWSGTDFFLTSAGIIGTETTIGGFFPYVQKYPISCRIRQAMQYGNNLDDYCDILLKENSGDYANSWLFGDIKSNEIMLLELGLEYHYIEKKKSGYFIGYNATIDPRIRNLECVDTGFNDTRRHQGARKVRLTQLMEENKGKIDINVAKMIISDHYDVYLKKINPCSRTVCSHYDLDGREYMSDPSRPKPYQPRGALDGNICTSDMAKNMSFLLRYGNSCGMKFDKKTFIENNPQWDYLAPFLKTRVSNEWTLFSFNEKKNKKTFKNIINETL
uniref:Uncharacterized protein n=1 Tax=viral metagenome TaxID=1070528 RepID=A0A6C0H5B5_9ZZZZ